MIAVSDVNYARKARPLSVQSRDACSQTEMVDDELFLKDVIIRLPSASILNNTNKPEMNCDDAEQGLNHESNGHRECRFVSVEINETDNVRKILIFFCSNSISTPLTKILYYFAVGYQSRPRGILQSITILENADRTSSFAKLDTGPNDRN